MPHLILKSTALAVGLLCSGAASAQIAATSSDFAAPIDDSALSDIAGREDTSLIAQSHQAATAADNRVGDNVQTGQVQISDNAFQNLSGLSVVSANTGNNVAMNASMNVNISISPNP